MTLHDEIHEQPESIARLLNGQRGTVETIASEILKRDIHYVFLAARGTSDNAGRYANYLWGACNHLPIALATPSLFTLYQSPPQLKNALVVAISQSGQSPDIVSVVKEGRRQGALTLSITNTSHSPLSDAADFVLDIQAGAEEATAATKTYTGELMAIAMISAALKKEESRWTELAKVPEWISKVLKEEDTVAQIAERYRYMQRCVVLGRGYNYSTVFEWALKLKELAYVLADPYSSADFLHGPLALVESGFPVMSVAPDGCVFNTMFDLLTLLKNVQKAELLIISDREDALRLAQSPIRLPAGMSEWVSPLVAIVPGQLFAQALTRAKGFDTETPRSIHKITETH